MPLPTPVGSSARSAAVVPAWLKSNVRTGSDSPCICSHGNLIACYRLFVSDKSVDKNPLLKTDIGYKQSIASEKTH